MEMKELVKQGIQEALDRAVRAGTLPQGEYPEVVLEVPPQKKFGDFATNIAMQSARIAHKSPQLIARAIVEQMDYSWLNKAEIAGAGFINFFLNHTVIYDTLRQILSAGEQYGQAKLRDDDSRQQTRALVDTTFLIEERLIAGEVPQVYLENAAG